jgi:hypothetical protein
MVSTPKELRKWHKHIYSTQAEEQRGAMLLRGTQKVLEGGVFVCMGLGEWGHISIPGREMQRKALKESGMKLTEMAKGI